MKSFLLPLVASALSFPAFAHAQCTPQWDRGFGFPAVQAGQINDSIMYDDGTGLALYVAGTFQSIDGTLAPSLAKLQGQDWVSVGGGIPQHPDSARRINALAVLDPDGPGPRPESLILGGDFLFFDGSAAYPFIATWDGAQWGTLGNGLDYPGTLSDRGVLDLAVFDSGGGPKLYAAGNFELSAGSGIEGIAMWNGSAWEAVGETGVPPGSGSYGECLAVHNDGSGPALYFGGTFPSVVGVAGSANIARWSGTAWSSVGGGRTTRINRMESFDPDGAGGSPPNLYVFGAGRVSHWSGTAWSSASTIPNICANGPVKAVTTFDGGTGRAIYVGANLCGSPGAPARLVRYDGTAFTQIGAPFVGIMSHLAVRPIGGTDKILATGGILGPSSAPGVGALVWTGTAWDTIRRADGTNSMFLDMEVYDADGSGPAAPAIVTAAPGPMSVSYAATNGIAIRNGTTWSSLGNAIPSSGVDSAISLRGIACHPLPVGDELFAFAANSYLFDFDNGIYAQNAGVFKLVSGTWQPVGAPWGFEGTAASPPNGDLKDLLTADLGAGPRLFAFGEFDRVDGASIAHAAMWSGSSWVALGAGTETNARVRSAIVFNDGSGPAIFVAGIFSAGNVLKWNGTAWSSATAGTPTPFSGEIRLMTLQGQLYGFFGEALYRWNGASWDARGSVPGLYSVFPIGAANPGDGERIYLGASETSDPDLGILPTPGVHIFEFDGSAITENSAMGRFNGQVPKEVRTLVEPDGSVSLYMAGFFTGVGGHIDPAGPFTTLNGISSRGLARWHCAPPACVADVDDGTGSGTPDGGVTIDDLLYYLVIFEQGDIRADVDDGSGTGTPDGGVTIDDLLYYLIRFENGC